MSLERVAWSMLLAHVFLSLFGLAGIAIMVPHPDVWRDWGVIADLFPLAVAQGGNVQIILGAAAVLAFGTVVAGPRAMAIFCAISVALSLLFEVTGTSFGWPFGNYEYTEMFGYKILGKVPPVIPLSWFSMGFSSFAVATALIRSWHGSTSVWPAIFLGSAMLVTWDVVLDPAMSHPSLLLQYWVWEDVGPYLGVPIVNFLGWMATGMMFMGISSLLDRRLRPLDVDHSPFFLVMYLCNLLFAAGICLGNQIWLPAMLGLALAAVIMLAWFRPWLRPAMLSGDA
jgi:putative membrane protein